MYVLGLSLGLSTSLLISWLTGAGKYEQAYQLNLQNLKITILLNACLSTLLACFGSVLLRIFTDDPAILSIGHTILFFDISWKFFEALITLRKIPCAEQAMWFSLWVFPFSPAG